MVVDGHYHLATSTESVLARMDANGVDRTVLVGVGVRDLGVVTIRDSLIFRIPFLLRTVGVWRSRAVVRSRRLRDVLLPEPDNDRVAAALRAHPDRFSGFVFVNPTHPRALTEVTRRLDAGFCGIKLALVQYPAPLDGPEIGAICELAEARHVPVFFHQGLTPATSDAQALVQRFARVSFIIAHAGVQYFRRAVAWASSHRNVWLDTSSYFVTEVKLRGMVRELGPRKLVFGSDVPVMARDAAEALSKIRALRLPASEQAAILGGNLQGILENG